MSCPLLLDCPSISDVSVLELIYSPLGRVIGGLIRGSISSHMGGGVSMCFITHIGSLVRPDYSIVYCI